MGTADRARNAKSERSPSALQMCYIWYTQSLRARTRLAPINALER